MIFDPRHLFPSLAPPPGGLPALRARLARDRRLTRARTIALAGLTGALLMVILCLRHSPHTLRDDLVQRDYPAMVALGLTLPPDEPVTLLPSPDRRAPLRRLPTTNPSVVVYVTSPSGTASSAHETEPAPPSRAYR